MRPASRIIPIAALMWVFSGSLFSLAGDMPFSYPPIGENPISIRTAAYPPYLPPTPSDDVDVVGDTVTIGTTWIEMQHAGTIGRMVVKDDMDYLRFVWMKGLTSSGSERHIYYNFIDPDGVQAWPGLGYPVEASLRAGYATLAVGSDGRAFPAFHEQMPQGYPNSHTAVAEEFFPYTGAFVTFEPDWLYVHDEDTPTPYPNISVDQNGRIHVVSTIYVSPEPTSRHVYTVGSLDPLYYVIEFPPDPETWTFVDRTTVDGADVTSSDVSDRVAVAWITPHHDVMLLIDEDGEDLAFEEAFNLTQFIQPDPSWLPDTLMADRDTLRAHNDLSLFFDQDDWLHVAFTTRAHFFYEWSTYVNASIIWHWSEEFPYDFSVVANAWDPGDTVNCGDYNLKAQRPSLGQDPSTGFFYCMYQMYDTDPTALSWAGWPSGEVYVSVSVDGGLNWAVGTNVTETVTTQGAPPGQSLSEECPCMAEVVDDECHIMYILDHDAGTGWDGSDEATLNEVKYHSVPVDAIPTTPLVPQVPFHVSPWFLGEDGSRNNPAEEIIAVHVLPNPFNPTATIEFVLPTDSRVSLKVYDLRGCLVSTLVNGWRQAGSQRATFDGSRLPSGVYFYRLNAGKSVVNGKLLLLK